MAEEIMTKRWKLKVDYVTFFFLSNLILAKAEWVGGENVEVNNAVDSSNQQTEVYVGNDEIANYFFSSTAKKNSSILEGVQKCLNNFQLITCTKMLLLCRVNDVVSLIEESNAIERDLQAFNGIFIFKVKNTTKPAFDETNDNLSLNEEIAVKMRRIFQKRSFVVNVFPKKKIEIEPAYENCRDSFLCFRYTIEEEAESANGDNIEGRKKKGGMPMMMLVPPLIMMGLMPFTLASLKAMVMNAVMINMMALNGAIFMTIRNLVFGPRKGDNVKYVNYGYSKDRQTQSRRPVLIIHSPAAFVKQPPVYRNRRPFTSYNNPS